jgi:hypothetical protein
MNHYNNQLGASEGRAMASIFYYDGSHMNHHNRFERREAKLKVS